MKCPKEMTPKELCDAFEGWVKFLARNYHKKVFHLVDLDELVNSGMLGLLLAQKKYDPEKGAFSSYSKPHIRRQFQRLLEERLYFHQNNARDAGLRMVHSVPDYGYAGDVDMENTVYFREVVDGALKGSSKTSAAMFRYYCEGKSMAVIGKIFGISRQAVSKRLAKIFKKMRGVTK